ncbi:MAG: class I mannose-6-phosphate isomerase [Lachnospiraceae bacterium]|nr:class I mannose-6-phosphate isomerase [Lachnospiraceae bacterium]
MTNKNTPLNHKPFLLRPVGKDYLWGGRHLKDDFDKNLELTPLAETWECSTHPDGPSVVASGEYEGMTLTEVLSLHPEYLGQRSTGSGQLPILIKLIDARDNLSVQVHPDDTYAATQENGSLGKTEMWYVLDAAPNANLIYGFHHDMKKERLWESLQNGTVEKYLQKVPVHKDDVFYIPAGTVHAIGAGTLIAEIQQSSNLTYRMYDYDRIDREGHKRPLHLDKALDVANLKASTHPRQPMRILRYTRGCASEFLCRCKYFQVERLLLNTEQCRKMADIKSPVNTFQVLLCISGCGVLYGEETAINFYKGDCIFLPADSIPMKLHGRAQMLRVNC